MSAPLTTQVPFCYTMGMINDNNKTFKVNLTHIATSYPQSVDLTDSQHKILTFKHLANNGSYLSSPLQDDVLDIIISKALGYDWQDQYFYDGLSHIKF